MKKIDEILAKEMTRKEFLLHLGVLILAVTGVSGLLSNLVNIFDDKHRTHGYGSSAYGGSSEN